MSYNRKHDRATKGFKIEYVYGKNTTHIHKSGAQRRNAWGPDSTDATKFNRQSTDANKAKTMPNKGQNATKSSNTEILEDSRTHGGLDT